MSEYRDLWPVVTRLRNCLHNLTQREPAVVCAEVCIELRPFVTKEVQAAALLSDAAALFRIAEDKLRKAHRLLEVQGYEYDDEADGEDDPQPEDTVTVTLTLSQAEAAQLVIAEVISELGGYAEGTSPSLAGAHDEILVALRKEDA